MPFRTEAARQKSRAYLNECLKEITYLLLPPNHPPPPNNITIDPTTGQPMDPALAAQKLAAGQLRPSPPVNPSQASPVSTAMQHGTSNSQPSNAQLPSSQPHEQQLRMHTNNTTF